MQASAQRVAHRFVTAGYYDLETGTPPKEVLRRWEQDGDKAYDRSMPVYYPPKTLWSLREYTWKRETARGGLARVKGKTVELPGPLKWDAMVADLKANGWDPKEPLHMNVGRNGQMFVREGNHRLAIALEAGLSKVPVWFHFEQKPRPSPEREPRKVEAPAPIVEKVIKRYVEKPTKMDPESEKQVDEILDLLGW